MHALTLDQQFRSIELMTYDGLTFQMPHPLSTPVTPAVPIHNVSNISYCCLYLYMYCASISYASASGRHAVSCNGMSLNHSIVVDIQQY